MCGEELEFRVHVLDRPWRLNPQAMNPLPQLSIWVQLRWGLSFLYRRVSRGFWQNRKCPGALVQERTFTPKISFKPGRTVRQGSEVFRLPDQHSSIIFARSWAWVGAALGGLSLQPSLEFQSGFQICRFFFNSRSKTALSARS